MQLGISGSFVKWLEGRAHKAMWPVHAQPKISIQLLDYIYPKDSEEALDVRGLLVRCKGSKLLSLCFPIEIVDHASCYRLNPNLLNECLFSLHRERISIASFIPRDKSKPLADFTIYSTCSFPDLNSSTL